METIKVAVETRDRVGKGAAHKLRRSGRIPAVLYGKGKPTVALAVPDVALRDTLATARHAVLALDLGAGRKENAVIKQVQYHPVRHQIIHLDLLAVDLDQEVEVPLLVELVGEAPGVEEGGILDHLLREVTVRGLADRIPESVQVDVSALAIGDHISVGQLPAIAGVTVQDDPQTLVLSVLAPRVAEEEVGLPEGEVPEEIGAAAGEEEQEES